MTKEEISIEASKYASDLVKYYEVDGSDAVRQSKYYAERLKREMGEEK